MFLLDTNIWLERLLTQEKSKVVAELLETLTTSEICISDFTLHSIGVICNRLQQRNVFMQFVQDVLIDGNVLMVTVPPNAMKQIVEVMDHFGLDFDDAYQCVVAERQKAKIVSFDKDFDKIEQGRWTPEQVLEQRRLQ